ncbi:MAG TPA: NAD(P)-dependent methylenetetrahydromethanopterin dehydrogenase [Pirellulales bacterium]|nr:NAD(P)-dependent methylenetetrahydromethanopterin dehydrogenase [Pirellulales bacterium]
MDRAKILLQLDTDDQPSVFDSVVALDSGEVDRLLTRSGVTPHNARSLVHGAIFTRGPDDLRRTAIFIGGNDVTAAEAVRDEVLRTFFGPLRVSVMIDPNGANTTAAAAVRAAAKNIDLAGAEALVLGATGPVGQRVVRLLAREGAKVRVASRSLDRSTGVCKAVTAKVETAQLTPLAAATNDQLRTAIEGVTVIIAAGAAGVELLSTELRDQCATLQVAIDLNAVPPLGIGGIEVNDRGVERNGAKCFGALAIGGTKMRLHKLAVKLLFESRDQVFDAEELYDIGRGL